MPGDKFPSTEPCDPEEFSRMKHQYSKRWNLDETPILGSDSMDETPIHSCSKEQVEDYK